MMDFLCYDWADSDIENICIEYDHAKLLIFNDSCQKRLYVDCYGFAGINNLCMWDDTIILSAHVRSVFRSDNDFVRNLYATYNENQDYGGRSLKNGLLELKIELVNGIVFSMYCQKIEVTEDNT
jgi:hypothetical protein